MPATPTSSPSSLHDRPHQDRRAFDQLIASASLPDLAEALRDLPAEGAAHVVTELPFDVAVGLRRGDRRDAAGAGRPRSSASSHRRAASRCRRASLAYKPESAGGMYNLLALPVVDGEGRLVGIATVDDVSDAMVAEETRQMQRLGGTEALGVPYMDLGFGAMVRKRAGWLSALFLGEMLTATAMGYFEHEIEHAVVLSPFTR